MKVLFPLYAALGLATVAAPTTFAGAPTLYGKINVTLDQFDHEGAGRLLAGQDAQAADQWELNSNASRLGVRGEIELEGTGLTAIYLLEYETNVDDGGSSPFSQRNIYAGLQGGFGRIIGGKFDTPVKTAEGRVDQFNDLRADLDYLLGGQNRADNIVQYSSPKLSGLFTANVALIVPEGADVDQDGNAEDGLTDAYGISLVADNGTYYGAIAYESNQAARRGIDLIGSATRADILRLVGTAKLGAFELGGLLQRASAVASGADGEDDSYLISGGWNIGKTKLKAQLGQTKGDTTGEKIALLAVGADYNLAAKTKLFAYFSTSDIDRADLADDTLAVGFDHSF